MTEGIDPQFIWDPATNPTITKDNLASFLIQTQKHRIGFDPKSKTSKGWLRMADPQHPHGEYDAIMEYVMKHGDQDALNVLTSIEGPSGHFNTSSVLRGISDRLPKKLYHKLVAALEDPDLSPDALAQGYAALRQEFEILDEYNKSGRHQAWQYIDKSSGQRQTGSTRPDYSSVRYSSTTPADRFKADKYISDRRARQNAPAGSTMDRRINLQMGRQPLVKAVLKSPHDKLALEVAYKLGTRAKDKRLMTKVQDVEHKHGQLLALYPKLSEEEVYNAVRKYLFYVRDLARKISSTAGKDRVIQPMSFAEFIGEARPPKGKS